MILVVTEKPEQAKTLEPVLSEGAQWGAIYEPTKDRPTKVWKFFKKVLWWGTWYEANFVLTSTIGNLYRKQFVTDGSSQNFVQDDSLPAIRNSPFSRQHRTR